VLTKAEEHVVKIEKEYCKVKCKSGVREFFSIFQSEGDIVFSHETFDLRPY
jgi:hypothetical protein